MTDISVLYEDNHLLLVVKPPGIPVQEDSSGDRDLLSLLKEDIRVRFNKPGNVYLGLVHRLDRPTGGVMVFARTSRAASRLSAAFRSRAVVKEYLLVTESVPGPPAGRMEDRLLKDTGTNTVRVTATEGKPASLSYRRAAAASGLHLFEVTLETGRSHQIRVQFASRGAPIWGDHRYGDRDWKTGEDLALWAHRLSFPHPVGGRLLTFEVPPPDGLPWSAFTGIKW